MSEKLQQIRKSFQQNNIQGYLVPHCDAHDSEYIAEADERLAYISGFTGSAGFAYISLEEAFCWTDSRYFIQAQKQLEQGWEMKKMERGYQPWNKFVLEKYSAGYKVGYDPLLMNAHAIQNVKKELEAKQIELVPVEQNLVDENWPNKPAEPKASIFIHDHKWHEYSFGDKYLKIQEIVKANNKADVFVTSKLDEIAWTLNMRGNDIDFNPVFKSYLVLDFTENSENNRGILYVDSDKIDETVAKYLSDIKVTVRPYLAVFEDLKQISSSKKVSFQTSEINRRLFESIETSNQVILKAPTPICILKAIKNEKEIQGFRNCHIRDGSALVSYLAWLENELVQKNNSEGWTEYSGALVLEKKRLALEYNKGLSFDTISSTGANGAVVHYKPEEKTAAILSKDEMYLLDSGGQYFDGTTDVTRTMHYTTPTKEQKDSYTRVLLGNLEVQAAIWPVKNQISGSDLDVLARRHLWAKKLDFGHGTGHGVGFFLNVHEGPQGISKYRTQVLQQGMTVTDEPGYYKEGEYGIRIEDLLVIIDKGDQHLGFENMTQCPYDQNLIDLDLLSKEHVNTINAYHQKVLSNILPILEKNNDQLAINWLKKHTQPIKI